MNISIVAATEMELGPLRQCFSSSPQTVNFLVHGVGMLQAMYHIQKEAIRKPDLILQCGVAGTYSDELLPGDTVVVQSECMGDTGAEEHGNLLDLFDLDLLNRNEFPFTNGLLLNTDVAKIPNLKAVRSITVNLTAGDEKSINARRKKFHPDIESMEGACLHYVCLQEQIPFMQFRGISNIVEPRDKSKWKLAEALSSCHSEIINFIHNIPATI